MRYLHPDHVTRNLAVEHVSGPMEGYRTVFGRDWIIRNLATIYVLFLPSDVVAVTLERNDCTYRYTLTDDEPDLPGRPTEGEAHE